MPFFVVSCLILYGSVKKKKNFHGKSSTSYCEKSANSSYANISQLISSITGSVCENAALVSHWLSSWVRIKNINIQEFKHYGQSVPLTINITYLGNTTRVQQKQTLDLCLLPFYLPKKHKSPWSLEANLKWLQSESEALFHLIYNSIYNTLNIHFCTCNQTFFVPLNVIGCHTRKESSTFLCFRTLFGTHPQQMIATNKEKCTLVGVKVLPEGRVQSRVLCGRCRIASPRRNADISTLQDRKKEE